MSYAIAIPLRRRPPTARWLVVSIMLAAAIAVLGASRGAFGVAHTSQPLSLPTIRSTIESPTYGTGDTVRGVISLANGPTDVLVEPAQLSVYRSGTDPLPSARLLTITAGESRKLAAGETTTIPFSFVQNLEPGRYVLTIQENSRATSDSQGAVGGAVSAVEFTVR